MEEKVGDVAEETRIIIARAASAVSRILRGREFQGKTSVDYALDAWIYNEQRGVSHQFTSRRARFLAIEDIRQFYGRNNCPHRNPNRKPRRMVLPMDPESHLMRTTPCHRRVEGNPELSHIAHEQFRFICECIIEGKTHKYAAEVLGVSESRIGQIIKKEKWRLEENDQ